MSTLEDAIERLAFYRNKRHDEAVEKYKSEDHKCPNCGKDIEYGSGKKFCNQSCAATFNNSKFPKRVSTTSPTLICERCGDVVYLTRTKGHSYSVRKYCDACVSILRHESGVRRSQKYFGHSGYPDSMTKGELERVAGTGERSRANITRKARKAYYISGRDRKCIMCLYDKHVEICHIRASSDFPDSATIGEINNLNNLVALCPTHHWEFDHGVISEEEIRSRII